MLSGEHTQGSSQQHPCPHLPLPPPLPCAASLGFNEGWSYDARLRCGHASCPNSSAEGVLTSLREMEPAAEGDISISTARLAAAQVPDTPLLSACPQGQHERGRLPLTSWEEKDDICQVPHFTQHGKRKLQARKAKASHRGNVASTGQQSRAWERGSKG